MGRGPGPYTQRGVQAALKAARNAGLPIARVKIMRDGAIIIETTTSEAAVQAEHVEGEEEINEWHARLNIRATPKAT